MPVPSSFSRICRSRGSLAGTDKTLYDRLDRSNELRNRFHREASLPSGVRRKQMSSCMAGVAEAVRARMGASGNCGRNSAMRK